MKSLAVREKARFSQTAAQQQVEEKHPHGPSMRLPLFRFVPPKKSLMLLLFRDSGDLNNEVE